MVSSLDNWDGSLSKPVKKNASRITDVLDSSAASGASTLNKTAEERINTVGIRNGWQTSLDVYDASTSNLNQPLSRAILNNSVLGDMSQSVPSLSPMRNMFSFVPVFSSPLHTKMSPVIQPPTLPNFLGPSSMNLDALELISTHTADGEGEDEDGDEVEIEDVADILAYPTYCEQNLSHSYDSPLFTPPPEEDSRSVNHLFTPSSSPKPSQIKPSSFHHQSRPRRLIMSHIQVPPLQRPRSDYRFLQTTDSVIVSKRRVAPNPHSSIQDALQASIQHNADIGVLPWDSLEKRKLTKKKRREDGGEIVIAGPSRPTGAVLHDKVARPKKRLKRSFIDDDNDDDWGAPPRSKKRPRPISEPVVVDLTITDDDEHSLPPRTIPSSTTQYPRPKMKIAPKTIPDSISKPLPKPRPSKFIHNSETDIVTLCLDDIRPVPLEILTFNTRFLRQSLGNDVSALGPGGYESANTNCIRQNGSRPCFLSINANSPATNDNVEEISVGGAVWELPEEEKEVIEILSDSSLKENVPQRKNVDVPSLPAIQVSSINQKKSQEPHHEPKQRRQSTGDDVNRSSSTFKTPLDVSSLPPRPTSSNLKDFPTTQYLKTQYPKKKGRESQHGQQQQPRKEKQTLGEDINGSSTTFNILHQPPAHSLLEMQPKIGVAPQHPIEPLESQLLRQHVNDSPVRPPHSARSSLNGTVDSGSDYPNGAMPSIKALGKRRATSPINNSVTTTPHRHSQFGVPPYSAASMRDIQLSSHRSSISTPSHYVVQNGDFNPFINYSTAISPDVQSSSAQANGAHSINTSSLSSSYNPLDTLASLFDQAASSSRNQSEIHIGSDMDSSRHTSTHSHTLVYNSRLQHQPESRGESFFSSVDSLYDDAGFPGDQHDHRYDQEPHTVDDPWCLGTNPLENQYAYETIDPTLLGGGALLGESELEPGLAMEMDADLDAVGMELESETGFDDQVRQKDSSQGGVDFALSNQASSSSSPTSGSTQEKETYSSAQSASTPDDFVPADVEEVKKEETYGRKLPPRKRIKRVMPDMISHDDIDLLSKRRKTNIRLSISSASSASDADRSESDSELDESADNKPTIRKPIPISKPKPHVSVKNPIARSVSPPIEKKMIVPQANAKQEWLLDKVDAYCHQCRRKTFYAKMTCSDCQKKFCVRCYAFRYPECEFDAGDKEYSCPACEGFCNCTACCRKRGEPYVGVRTCDPVPDSPPLRPKRLRNTNVERVKLGAKTNLPPPTTTAIQTTTIPKGVTTAWGSLYSVTGEKIGACFFDPSAEKDNSVVFAPATTPIITTITEVAQQVTTAEQQVTTVAQQVTTVAQQMATVAPRSEPKIQVKTKTKLKRRIFIGEPQSCWGYKNPKIKLLKPEPYSKRSYQAMPRFYIGKRACLFYPIEEDDSSLTPMDESDETPDGPNAEGKSFSPDSLGDGDVTRAILLGLSACGVAAVEVPTT